MSDFSKLSGTVTWGNGSLFDGFAIVSLVPPKAVDGTKRDLYRGKIKIPLETKVPIVSGVFAQTEILYNSSITPPNSQYIIKYYDLGGDQVGGPDDMADAFTITAATTTPPIYITEVSDLAVDLP